jgi:S-DNA-T family DNA segregation ATPase FtsK/SpoIIIE
MQDRQDAATASYLARKLIVTIANLGFGRDTESCAGLPGYALPTVLHVHLGETNRITLRMMDGQLPSDYRAVSSNLAEAFGCHRVRVERRSYGRIVLVLQRVDYLTEPVQLPGPLAMADHELLVGMLDDGRNLVVRLSELAHILVQGQTRSGKSRFVYGLFSQLSEAEDVLICGSDITGLVLRPFAKTRHGLLTAMGTKNPEAHADLLDELVSIMDDRIARMPDDLDVFPCTVDDPYMLTVLEELPGLLRVARGTRGLADRIKDSYGRLVSEGAKAGFRLLVVMQRADANLIGGYERGQMPLKISFSVDDPAAVKMLHPTCSDDMAMVHIGSEPNRALVSMPGLPLGRFRAPEMASYQQYRANVLSPIESVAV